MKSPNFNFGNSSPYRDELSTKAETLKEISYPTGGHTLFEYEGHKYSKIVDNISHGAVSPAYGFVGGLRIKQIVNIDVDGKIAVQKRYYYSENKGYSELSQGSGVLKGKPSYSVIYKLGDIASVEMASEGGYFPELVNQISPEVGYSCVIEETLDSLGHSCGYVKYHYTNYDSDIYGMSHMDEHFLYSCNISGESSLLPFTSNSAERGKLLSKEFYNSDGKLLRTEKIKYKRVGEKSFKTATQNVIYFSTDPGSYLDAKVGWVTKTHTYSYLPVSTKVTEYNDGIPYVCEQRKGYDEDKFLTCDSCLTSSGKWLSRNYFYPKNFTCYKWMLDKHTISPIVRNEKKCGYETLYEINTYFPKNGIPYLKKKQIGHDERWLNTKYEITKVDAYLNPIEIKQKGETSVLVWGGSGQKLIARFDNVTYKQMNELLGKDVLSFSKMSMDKIDYEPLLNVRSLLPQTLSTIYMYDSALRLVSVTKNTGFTNYYSYDLLDRLREEYFFDEEGNKQILRQYDYNYISK